MKYKIFTEEELALLIGNALLQSNNLERREVFDNVYEELFAGLDLSKISSYCRHISASAKTKTEQSPILNMLEEYICTIAEIVPLWRNHSASVSKNTNDLSERLQRMFSYANDARLDDLETLYEETLASIETFRNENTQSAEQVQSQQTALVNFIGSSVEPMLKDEMLKAETDDVRRLVKNLLNDDIFISGTKVATYNVGTLFSFTDTNLARSMEIVLRAKKAQSPLDILFTLGGHSDIFTIISAVTSKLYEHTKKFRYNHKNKGGKTMSTSVVLKDLPEEIIRLKEQVESVSQAAISAGAVPPFWKIARLHLSLMNGDPNALKDVSTVSPPVRLGSTPDALTSGASELAKETSNTSIEGSRGLLGLTKENVRDIIHYVNTSLGFPTDIEETEKRLGYDATAKLVKEYPIFSPESFLKFYKPFTAHAEQWWDLENGKNGIIPQGNSIATYAKTFTSHAKMFLSFIMNMDVFPDTVEDVVLEEKDKKTVKRLSDLLPKWQNEINMYQDATNDLLERLTRFQATLVNTLQPSARKMLAALDNIDLATETKQLKQEMDELQKQIDALQKEYDMNVGLAFTGAAGMVFPPIGIITWAVTGGVYGDRAEKARKKRNRTQAEYNAKMAVYNSLNSLSKNVHDATSGVADLNLAVTNAIVGLNTLNAVWNSLTEFIAASNNSLKGATSKTDIMEFYFDLQAAHDSWSEVKPIAEGLLDLFKSARQNALMMFLNSSKDTPLSPANHRRFDLAKWQDNFETMNRVIIDPKAEHMPTLQKKAHELRGYAREIFSDVTKNLSGAVAIANIAMSAADIDLYEKMQERLADDPKDEGAKKWLERLLVNFTTTGDELNAALAKIAGRLHSNAVILEEHTRTDLSSTRFYALLNEECLRFEKSIQQHTRLMIENFIRPMFALTKQIEDLDAEISNKVDPENVLRSFKEFFPEAREISGFISKGADPKTAAALMGIGAAYSAALSVFDVIGSIAGLVADTHRLVELNNQLRKLREEYNKIHAAWIEMTALQSEIEGLVDLISPFAFFGEEGIATVNYLDEIVSEFSMWAKKPDLRAYRAAVEGFIDNINAGRRRGLSINPYAGSLFKPLVPLLAGPSFDKITYTQGYGQISKAGVSLAAGVKGEVEISLKITSFSDSFYEAVTNSVKNTVSEETLKELTDKSTSRKDWWFAFFAGGTSQSSDHFRNEQQKTIDIAETEYFDEAKEQMTKNTQEFEVKGKFIVEGKYPYPTEVFLFIETLTIQTSDGTTFIVPTENTAVADKHGNTSGADITSGKINIMPLG